MLRTARISTKSHSPSRSSTAGSAGSARRCAFIVELVDLLAFDLDVDDDRQRMIDLVRRDDSGIALDHAFVRETFQAPVHGRGRQVDARAELCGVCASRWISISSLRSNASSGVVMMAREASEE